MILLPPTRSLVINVSIAGSQHLDHWASMSRSVLAHTSPLSSPSAAMALSRISTGKSADIMIFLSGRDSVTQEDRSNDLPIFSKEDAGVITLVFSSSACDKGDSLRTVAYSKELQRTDNNGNQDDSGDTLMLWRWTRYCLCQHLLE